MGIGQIPLDYDWLKVVDYLPYMYMYEILWLGKNPDNIMSYLTMIYPLDSYVWTFIFVSTISAYITLILIQKLWSYAAGQGDPSDYLYKGDILGSKYISSLIIHFFRFVLHCC